MARDHLTPYELSTTHPESARLDIPLKSVVNLRRVAEELRGLASRLDIISRDGSQEAPALLNEAWFAVRHTHRRLDRIKSPGRPKKRVHTTRWL